MNSISKIIFILMINIFYCTNAFSINIPENGKAIYDIIRKNKVIGKHEIIFTKNAEELIIETNINIEVKVLFIPAYKFLHSSKETWLEGEFVKFEGYTDFEDEREYFIDGEDNDEFFIAKGMDGLLTLNKDIIPSNFWNIDILNQKELFDIQKGIMREIIVKDLGQEKVIIDDNEIISNKYSLNASTNPKDKGPFPEYTLWYNENGELMKFKFTNWKDKKVVTLQRKF